ncbi:BsaWI family type II restriction enzyme [Ignavibacterium sp.]|uniref:BsaWI family type II restriction enzyme n=1 Tax=Ignavibacterium sp. TaxID=2651167 RepID=UPI00307E57EA
MLDSEAQGRRASEGRRLEDVVSMILNELLNSHNIFIVRGNSDGLRTIIHDQNLVNEIIDYNRLPVKRPCDQKQLMDYPDSDLFILVNSKNTWRLLGIINCKVSFHSRHTMVTFWGLAVRISSNIKYVLVTEDKDQYHPEHPRSELGRSCSDSTSTRRLLESFVDRIYIIKPYNLNDQELQQSITSFKHTNFNQKENQYYFDNPNHPHHTKYCLSVRPFDDLIFDLLRWKNDLL